VKLSDRGCVFHVLWFGDEADLCIPTRFQTSPSLVSKYRLAREVLIQHLSRPVALADGNSTTLSYLFPGLESSSFHKYLDINPLRFFLGSSAHTINEGNLDGGTPLGMLHHVASAGYCVAFIEEIEFRSSKV
jgi:ATP-dependent RNA helicase DDX60